MAKFIKHVGKVGDRKVAVIFRQVPGEDHMCLIVYTETLNQNVHDPMMAAIESPQGQEAKELGDALSRAFTVDGKIILNMLHAEGMMKKMQTNQVVMTPTPGQSIRLNELNELLNQMEKGEDAVKKLAEIDASRGLQDPKDVARRIRESDKAYEAKQAQVESLRANPDSVIGDNQFANNLRSQAARMAAEARGLLAESERLMGEANQLDPVAAPKKARTTSTKKINTVVVAEQTPAKKPGRPKKAAVTG